MMDSAPQGQQLSDLAAEPGTASIGGRAWHDANGNGVQDAGEPGLAWQSLYVYGYADDSTYMIATDANGDYQLDGLIAGAYYLQFQPRYNGQFTAQRAGDDPALDSDADATGRVDTFTLAAGEQRDTVDVGMVLTDLHDASIRGRAWFDANANGQFDFGDEFNMPGVGVTLRDVGADGLLGMADDSTQRTSTNGTGWYEFYDLPAGRYQVVFDAPVDYRFTTPDVPTGYEGWDSDADASGATPVIQLGMGDYALEVADAGFMRPDGYNASVSGTAWVDFEGNGVQDSWVLGMWNTRVYLYSYVDGSTQTTLTDPDGHYTFFGLAPGEYYLLFEGQAGYAFTTTGAGDDDTLDSDADSAGYVAAFALAAGEQRQSADAGQVYIDTRSAGVADRAWHDLNANGVQDTGEAGAADMRVYLYSYSDGSTAVTFTDAQGQYRFADLAAGEYYLLFEGWDGYGFTAAGQGMDATRDSDVRASGHSAAFDLGIGEHRGSIAAGLVALEGGEALPEMASILVPDGGLLDAALGSAESTSAWWPGEAASEEQVLRAMAAAMDHAAGAQALLA